MRKKILRINGCDLILEFKGRFKYEEEMRIELAEDWIYEWIYKANPELWHYYQFERFKNVDCKKAKI